MVLSKVLFISIGLIAFYSCNNADPSKDASLLANLNVDSAEAPIGVEAPKLSINQRNTFEVVARIPTQLLTYTSLSGDLRSLMDEVQRFTIYAGRDTGIICKEGTVLYLKAGAFVLADSQSVIIDSVFLEVREFYKISDILLAGLSTHSGDKVLETGGMIFIEAWSKGRKCALKQGSVIDLGIPYKQRKDSMQLFTGVWNDQQLNWLPLFAKDSVEIDVEEAAEYPGGPMALNEFLGKHIKFPEPLAELNSIEQVFIDFEINEQGKVVNVKVKEPVREEFRNISLQAVARMPAWKPAIRKGKPVTSFYRQKVVFLGGDGLFNDKAYQLSFRSATNDSSLKQVKASSISQYIFSTSMLGWINCDRFYREGQMTELSINCGKHTDIDVKLVLHSIRSILFGDVAGTVCRFRGIPENEVVTVVVIKKINDKVFVALLKTNTNVSSITDLPFEEVTMEKLKQKLEQLNTLTN